MVYAIFSASVLLAIGAIYAGAVGWLYFRQERLLFEPDPLPADEPICNDADTRELCIDERRPQASAEPADPLEDLGGT